MATFKTTNWPSARLYAEAIQFPSVCFSNPVLRATVPAVDRLGMPIVTSGQFAYVYKLKSRTITDRSYAVRCFRSHSADRELRYSTISRHLSSHDIPCLAS